MLHGDRSGDVMNSMRWFAHHYHRLIHSSHSVTSNIIITVNFIYFICNINHGIHAHTTAVYKVLNHDVVILRQAPSCYYVSSQWVGWVGPSILLVTGCSRLFCDSLLSTLHHIVVAPVSYWYYIASGREGGLGWEMVFLFHVVLCQVLS